MSEEKIICSHKFAKKPEVRCDKAGGHSGGHSSYHDTGGDTFKHYIWNDDSEVPVVPEEYGRAFSVNYDDGHDERQRIMDLAILDAKKTLSTGVGVIFEVRAKETPKKTISDYGRAIQTRDEAAKEWGICWYYVPHVKQPAGLDGTYSWLSTAAEPLFQGDVDCGERIELGGYILLARIKA